MGNNGSRSHRDGSFEYPQHMFWLRYKKIKFSFLALNLSPVHTCKTKILILDFPLLDCFCVNIIFLLLLKNKIHRHYNIFYFYFILTGAFSSIYFYFYSLLLPYI